MIAIKGKYKIKQYGKVIVAGENLITSLGESFFMNRWCNDGFEPIKYIVFGKGTARPTKSDANLGKLTAKKECSYKVNIREKKVELTCELTPSEALGLSEIGVSNGDFLLSHDLFKAITNEDLVQDNTSSVHIEYDLELSTSAIRSNWEISNRGEDIYYIYEPSGVENVSGYIAVTSFEDLDYNNYFYEYSSKNLYIKSATVPTAVVVEVK